MCTIVVVFILGHIESRGVDFNHHRENYNIFQGLAILTKREAFHIPINSTNSVSNTLKCK